MKIQKKIGISPVMKKCNSHTSRIGFGSPDLNLIVVDIKGWVMHFPATEKNTGQENLLI